MITAAPLSPLGELTENNPRIPGIKEEYYKMSLPNLKKLPPSIFSGDWHLTNRPADEYRWKIFDWLKSKIKKYAIEDLWLLGDLTDAKDNHSSVLVNRVVNEMKELSEVVNLYFIIGNHDCIDRDNPYFEFLEYTTNIKVFIKPQLFNYGGVKLLILPHTRNTAEDWKDIDPTAADLILMHHTVRGSMMSNGTRLDAGVDIDWFQGVPTISGDVHVPQTRKNITYTGSPYHVHFNDRFDPRVLMWERKKWKNLRMPAPSRFGVTLRKTEELYKVGTIRGDQIKIKLKLPKSEVLSWDIHREEVLKICEELGIECYGIDLEVTERKSLKTEDAPKEAPTLTPTQLFETYCTKSKLDKETIKVGEKLLESA